MPAEARSVAPKLPNEILLLIFEQLEFNCLRAVSVANKHMNKLSNLRLWRKSSLFLGHESSSMHLSRCLAILRDPIRAQCVETLTIDVYHAEKGYGFATAADAITHIRDVLLLLHSLKKLVLKVQGQSDRRSLSKMLSANASRFPFRIRDLDLDKPPPSDLRSFLQSQDSIAFYRTRWSGTGWWDRLDPIEALDTSEYFPRLRRFKGSVEIVKDLIRGRQLQSVELEGIVDRVALRMLELAGPFPDQLAVSLAAVHELHMIWENSHLDIDKFFPRLSAQCGISLLSIGSLFLEFRERNKPTISLNDLFQELPNLVHLHWEFYDDKAWDNILADDFVQNFAQDAAKASPLFSSVTMASFWGTGRRFSRVEGVTRRNGATESRQIEFTDTRGLPWFLTMVEALPSGDDWNPD